MDREEFFEWLNTCTTSWDVEYEDGNKKVWVSFKNIQEYDDDE